MSDYILVETEGSVQKIILNRPKVLNAWHSDMRSELVEAFCEAEAKDDIGAVVITGAGDRAFSAGQDLNETKDFDAARAEKWVEEWELLYDTLRSSSKPIIAALNGVAAGSAFQVALLCDFRIAHSGVRMGQPEILSGIASTTGPWIMREHLGLARTIELTLTGKLIYAKEAEKLGIVNKIVDENSVMDESLKLAKTLADLPENAMRLDKQRFKEMTELGFRDCLEAGKRIQSEAYASGEPRKMMEKFLSKKK